MAKATPPKGYTETMTRLLDELATLPGVGAKSAERIAYHIMRLSTDEAMRLAYAIRDVKKNVRQCSRCFNLSESDPCPICADPDRDPTLVCVVEQPRDVLVFEQTGRFRGLYHVLTGRIAPLDGSGPENLTVPQLCERVRREGVREVILATNPDLEGDGTALFLAQALKDTPARVTRIGRGIPTGSLIEYASLTTLADALEARRDMTGKTDDEPDTDSG
jgi:recombination protein RecR